MSIGKIFCTKVSCLTESKALEKSMDASTTYSLSFNKFVICWSKSITAAVVDPVGLKANWSSIDDDIGCCIHSFIHSGHFYSAPSSPLLLRAPPDYSTDTVSEFHAHATAGKGLAQGPYVTARAGVEPTTLRLR